MIFGLFETARDRRQLELMEQICETLKKIDSKLDDKNAARIRKTASESGDNRHTREKRTKKQRYDRGQEQRIERHYQKKYGE